MEETEVLVTGAGGFLGGRLAQLLCARGQRVRVLLRSPELPEHMRGLPIRVMPGRLEDEASLRAAVAGVTAVHNCAGCSKDWAPWAEYHGANVAGVENLLRACEREASPPRLLHVSTEDVYGYPETPCPEEGPLVDTGLPYNRSKRLGDLAVQQAHRRGLPVTILRPGTIFGPRSKDFVVEFAQLLRQGAMPLIGGGRAHGGFIYVDDVAEAMQRAAESPQALGQAYNIGPDPAQDLTWQQYTCALADALGLRRPRLKLPLGLALKLGHACELFYGALRIQARPLLTRHACYLLGRDQSFPTEKAQRELGFRPAFSIEQGITESVRWLRQSGL